MAYILFLYFSVILANTDFVTLRDITFNDSQTRALPKPTHVILKHIENTPVGYTHK